jgi:hypothetical protein
VLMPGDSFMRSILITAGLIMASLIPCLAISMAPKDTNILAAIVAPGSGLRDAAKLAGAADAQIVRQGAFPFIWVFASDRPDLSERLYANGAWLVLDPLIGGCGDAADRRILDP